MAPDSSSAFRIRCARIPAISSDSEDEDEGCGDLRITAAADPLKPRQVPAATCQIPGDGCLFEFAQLRLEFATDRSAVAPGRELGRGTVRFRRHRNRRSAQSVLPGQEGTNPLLVWRQQQTDITPPNRLMIRALFLSVSLERLKPAYATEGQRTPISV